MMKHIVCILALLAGSSSGCDITGGINTYEPHGNRRLTIAPGDSCSGSVHVFILIDGEILATNTEKLPRSFQVTDGIHSLVVDRILMVAGEHTVKSWKDTVTITSDTTLYFPC